MANRFQQSVMQRLEQEEKIHPKQNHQTKTIKKPQTKSTNKEEFKEHKQENSEPATKLEIFDMAEYLRIEPSRSAKNKTFYLDVEVIEKLCEVARRQNVTDSKLCNDILRRVLGIGAKQ